MRKSKISILYTKIAAMQQHIFERIFLGGYSSLFCKHGYCNMHVSWTKTTSSLVLTFLSKTSKSETLLPLQGITATSFLWPFRRCLSHSGRTTGRSPAPPAPSPFLGAPAAAAGGARRRAGTAHLCPPVLTHPSRQVPGGQAPAHRLPLILQQREGGSQPVALPLPVVSPAQPQRQPQQHPAAAQPQVPRQVHGTEPQQRPCGGREQQPRQSARPPGGGARGSRGIHVVRRSPPLDFEGSPLPSAPSRSAAPAASARREGRGDETRRDAPRTAGTPARARPASRAMALPSEAVAAAASGHRAEGSAPGRAAVSPALARKGQAALPAPPRVTW